MASNLRQIKATIDSPVIKKTQLNDDNYNQLDIYK